MSVFTIATIAALLIIVCLLVIFLLPDEKAAAEKKQIEKVQKRKVRKEREEHNKKDWEKIAIRYQSQLHRAKNEIGQLEKKNRDLAKRVLEEEVKNNKWKEKYNKEKEWIAKKEEDVGKKEKNVQKIKDELKKVQDQFSDEHILTIRLNKEVDALKKENDLEVEQRRLAENECAQLKTQNHNYQKELNRLKMEVSELKKKENDQTFVAQSEYVKVKEKLVATEKELQRVVRNNREADNK